MMINSILQTLWQIEWSKGDIMWPSDLQGRPCSAGWWFGSGLRGGRDPMWAQHDVFGASLPPRQHLQPQHLPGLLALAHLLPPRGESVTAARRILSVCLSDICGRTVVLLMRLNVLLSVPQTCSNEVKCICDPDYTGKDCSVFDPIPIPTPPEGPEKYKGNQFASTVQKQWLPTSVILTAMAVKNYMYNLCLPKQTNKKTTNVRKPCMWNCFDALRP